MSKRKICIVTGSRAEYGLLYWLMHEVKNDPELELQVVVTGMHLSDQFGLTYKVIEKDGFSIHAKIDMLLSSDSSVAVTKSMGLGVIGFAEAFERLTPDIVVVLGDRFEMLAVCQAAMMARIPIAHIHGGETTEGALDEGIRHSITKMAQYHFVAAEAYRKRVVQLGEDPARVFNYGAPGLDHLEHLDWLSTESLKKMLDIPDGEKLFLITYHPATLGDLDPAEAMNELLTALEAFPDAVVVFTYPNADTGGRSMIEQVDKWIRNNADRARCFISLGQQRYLSLLRASDVVIGNSSSGLTEAPALKKAVVNIGDRQGGRLKADCVIDTGERSAQIIDGISKALSPAFVNTLPETVSLYGTGNVSSRIKEKLKIVPLTATKRFFNIDHAY